MYNGEELNSSTPQYMKAYVDQFDLHHPEMTVRETLNFSSNLLETNNAFGMFPFIVYLYIF
jgi:ABC-type multidrug transport system ATPase subunit